MSFYLDDILIDITGVLNYPTIIELLSTSCFKSLTDHFIYFGAPMLGTYILITATSSWWIAPSIITHHLSLFLFHFLTWSLFFLVWLWQYMLCFGCHLLEISSSVPSLWCELKWVSWRQHIVVLVFQSSYLLFIFWLINSTTYISGDCW